MLKTQDFDDAKSEYIAAARAAAQAERRRPKTFEEQLRLVANGQAKLTTNFMRRHLEPKITDTAREMTATRAENLHNPAHT